MKIIALILVFATIYIENTKAQCFNCNPTTGFACVSIDQYVTCTSGSLNLNAITTCSSNLVCNQDTATTPCISAGSLIFTCTNSHLPTSTTTSTTSTTSTSTTSSTTSTTSTSTTAKATTALSSFSARSFCSGKGAGRFLHPSYTDCTHYVYCYLYNNTLAGSSYNCQGGINFNSTLQACDANTSC